jgi:predicted transport protein
VPATLVMQLFHCYDRLRTLSGAEFVEAVELVESYVLRRAICGEQTRGYWQVFAGVALKIDPERPLETLKVELARMRGTYRFPSDEDFRRALEESDIYGKRVCHDLLDRFENHGSREPTDTSRYSIEHIMPQNERLSPEWRAMLGENWRDLHGVWLHRLGNLTLTSYNSTYSDHPFEEKKTVKDGFNDSSVRLNKYVRERKVWTEREMEERGRDLAGEARAIWPGLHVEQQLIDAASRRELRERAKRNDVSKVKMTPKARGLFNALRPRVKNIDAEIIELAEANSVSFHAASFFLEVIPRASGLTLLLDLDFNEVVDTSGIAQDASQWKYFKSAAHGGGVTIAIYGEADIEKAMPVIRQAYTVSAG